MFRTYTLWVGVCLTALSITGCFAPTDDGTPEFTSNDTAKTALGGQSWESEGGDVGFAFDANAKLIELSIPELLAEVPGFNITGEPFTLTVPADIPVVGGMSLTVSFENVSTQLIDGRLTMQFWGDTDQSIGVPLVGEFDHLLMTLSADVDPDAGTISNIDGSIVIVVTSFGEEMDIDLTDTLLGEAGFDLDDIDLNQL